MNRIVHLIEEHNLFTPELVKNFVLGRPLTELRDFSVKLEQAIADELPDAGATRDPLSFYNFMASACLRGDNCPKWNCRLSKAQTLARYAVLYCDEVLLPLWFKPAKTGAPESVERELLGGALLTLIELRAVIEKGLVKLVPHDLHLCTEHLEEAVPGFQQMISRAKRRVSGIASKFRIRFDNFGPYGGLFITGPEDFIEHGAQGIIFHQPAEWTDKLKLKSDGQKILSTRFAIENELLEYIFDDPAMDAALQQYYSLRFRNKYLTNLPAEAYLLSQLNKKEDEPPPSTVSADLSHKLPLLKDLPIDVLLKIRAEEYDGFLLYRNALERAAKERFKNKTQVTEAEAAELYNDLLLPELLQLRAKIRASRRMSKKRSFLKSTVASAVVLGLGVFSGLPAKLVEWAGSIQGVNLAREIGEAKLSTTQTDATYQAHELYFLLRASEYLGDE
ncbi:MAG: hypothetical protein DMG65_14365 [Candidatus Angelobacter sp. Gp1-AA117]|nr:MAG: hypothetical protein DMG65_14365 [Candidatus Angelobacter sp. Gp1-AA117]